MVMNWILREHKGAEKDLEWLQYFDVVRDEGCTLCVEEGTGSAEDT